MVILPSTWRDAKRRRSCECLDRRLRSLLCLWRWTL